jgi:hypothetical protein
MPIDTHLRWLKTEDLSPVAKRFATFCKDDIEQYKNDKNFELDIYQDAIRFVVKRLHQKTIDSS